MAPLPTPTLRPGLAQFSHLPQELLDAIVDCGAADPDYLRLCALVCRSLRLRAQKRLFAKFTLSDATSLERLSNITQTSYTRAETPKWLLRHLLDAGKRAVDFLLKSQADDMYRNALIPVYVTDLTVRGISGQKIPATLISRCTGLAKLVLADTSVEFSMSLDAACVAGETGCSFPSPRPKIKELDVHGCSLSTVKTIVDSLVDISQLTKITLSTDIYPRGDDSGGPWFPDPVAIKSMLTQCKYSLDETILFYGPTSAPSPLRQLNFAWTPNLRKLQLAFFTFSVSENDANAALLLSLLKTITPRTNRISRIGMTFSVHLTATTVGADGSVRADLSVPPAPFLHAAWAEVDRVLVAVAGARRMFVVLDVLGVRPLEDFKRGRALEAESRTLGDTMAGWAKERLPLATAAGEMVQVKCCARVV